MQIYNIYQSGKNLYLDEKENPDNKIVVNKYDNEQQTLRLVSDGTLPPRLYWALRNPRLSNKYFILKLINNEDLIVGTDISTHPGLWDMLLIGTNEDYIIEGTDIDQSRLTYVSDHFGRLFVRDNFLEELDFEEQTSPTFRIFYDNLLDRVKEFEQGGVTDEQVGSAVEKYLDENPIDSITEEEKEQWNGYQAKIDEMEQNMAHKDDIPVRTSQLENDSGHITVETQGLKYYYKKTETYNQDEIKQRIPTKISQLDNDSGYITKEDIPNIEIPDVDLSEYATKEYVEKYSVVLSHDGNGNATIEGLVVLVDGNEVEY